MGTSAFERWMEFRKRWHHDRFKNKYFVMLAAHARDADAALDAGRPLPEPFILGLMAWPRLRRALAAIIRTAEAALDPVQLVDGLPFTALAPRDLEWLRQSVHERYVAREEIRGACSSLRSQLEATDEIARALQARLAGGENAAGVSVAQFHSACLRLSAGISALPSSIRVLG